MEYKKVTIDRPEINKYISGHDAVKMTSKFREELKSALLKECLRLNSVIENTKCQQSTHGEGCEPCLSPSIEILKLCVLAESLERFLQKNVMDMLNEIRKNLKDQLDRNGISYEASYDNLKKDA